MPKANTWACCCAALMTKKERDRAPAHLPHLKACTCPDGAPATVRWTRVGGWDFKITPTKDCWT